MTFEKGGTFISLGNAKQKFTRLLNYCVQLESILPRPIIVQHGNTDFSAQGFECFHFLPADEYVEMIKASRVVILHAGAGSIINSIKSGKKPIVIARISENNEHINNHQVELAARLADDGYVYSVSNITDLKIIIDKILYEEGNIPRSSKSLIYRLIEISLNKIDKNLNKSLIKN
jgi:UDP-N-acetylglucosamine transferase subunit ALG13